MGIEELKQQLKDGKITKEQFIEQLKALLEAGTIDQATHDAAVAEANDGGQAAFSEEQLAAIQKMMQSSNDQIRTQYSKEKKDLEDQLEKMKKDQMTAEQQAEYDRQKAAQDLADRETKLNLKEVALHTVDVLTDLKLPLRFKKFTEKMTDKAEAEALLKDLGTEFNAALNEAVQNRFKEAGAGTPPGGQGGTGGAKAWDKMTATEQGKLYNENPEQARAMAAAAGTPLKY